MESECQTSAQADEEGPPPAQGATSQAAAQGDERFSLQTHALTEIAFTSSQHPATTGQLRAKIDGLIEIQQVPMVSEPEERSKLLRRTFVSSIWPAVQDDYKRMMEELKELLEKCLMNEGIYAWLSARVKEAESIEKSLRRRDDHLAKDKGKRFESLDDVLRHIHDLVGLKIVVPIRDQLTKTKEFIERTFSQQGKPTHFPPDREVGQKWKRFEFGAYETFNYRLSHRTGQYRDVTFEVQLTGLGEHLFNIVNHPFLYKSAYGSLTEADEMVLDQLHGYAKGLTISIQQLVKGRLKPSFQVQSIQQGNGDAVVGQTRDFLSRAVQEFDTVLNHVMKGIGDKTPARASDQKGPAEQLSKLFERIQVAVNADANGNSCLAALRTSDPRHDKARIEGDKGGLLADVYQWVLGNDEFLRWRHDNQNRLLWVKGDPGKGKTMLLCGIIKELEKEGGLLSYFFCQATDARINSATAVLRGLIYMLVDQQPLLLSHVQKRYGHADRRLFEDVNAWVAVREIFLDILGDPALQSPYLVVDALDECQAGRSELLGLIASSAASRAKWVVSSRNWREIESRLAPVGQKVPLNLELNAHSVSSAVQLYVREKVKRLAEPNQYDAETTDKVTKYLLSNARDTFLWVALVCQSLKDVHRCDAIETLRDFPPGLDALYGRMMQTICDFGKPRVVARCLQILSTVSTVYRPLTLKELTSFIDNPFQKGKLLDGDALEYYVGLCGSFLAIKDHTIHFVHQSAKDFLCNPSLNRHFHEVFPCTIEGVHHAIFSKSLQLLSRTLQRDMYRLSHPGTPVEDAAPPSPDPLGLARYSCVYWADHLVEAQARSADELQNGGAVDGFLREKYLNWLEALSLARAIPMGVLAMQKLQGLFQTPKHFHLSLLMQDMHRFVLSYRIAIEKAPLQAYVSGLVFSPTQSLTRQLFAKNEPKWLVNMPMMEGNWNACFATFEGHNKPVNSVAFSHDGRQLASASHDDTVKLWNAATGACVATLEGHSDWVRSVAFSHDGRQLASASDDGTVKLWDAATGACVVTLEGHSDLVRSVTFSHDGRQLASASYDVALGHRTGKLPATRAGIHSSHTARLGHVARTCSIGAHRVLLLTSIVCAALPAAASTCGNACSHIVGVKLEFTALSPELPDLALLPAVPVSSHSALSPAAVQNGCRGCRLDKDLR